MGILNIGFMGLGNFGGQLANAAAKEGFHSIAFNASKKDMDMLSDDVMPFLIGDGKGTGKSRDTAKDFLLDHINVVKDENITKFIDQHDAIIVGGSAGGGFGSGATPALVSILSQIYPDKCFIIITTFPSSAETYTAQNHTEQFMRDVLELNVPYIIYDNDNFKGMEASDMNKQILANAVLDMKILRGDYIFDTATGGIDERDMMTVISAPGRMMCVSLLNLEESQVVNNSIVATLRDSLDKTGNVQYVDDKVIDASATMYNFSKDLKKYAPNIATEIQSVFGEHISDFRNEVMDCKESEPFIVCVLAGLTAPTTRIDKVVARRQAIEKEINERQAASTKLNTVEQGGLKLGVKSFGNKAPSKPNVDEIIKKFTGANNQ